MNSYFVDLHIHIGRTVQGQPVKISGSKDLTFFNIAHEASERKGMDMIGIIDCHSPGVQAEIADLLERGEMVELPGGGIRYRKTTVILGSEIEVGGPQKGAAHLLAFLPSLSDMRLFTAWMSQHMKNVQLSSQRIYVAARELQREVCDRGGILIPAHVFTPHKGLYGSCVERMADLLDPDRVCAIELGLSADSEMAGTLSELDRYAFLSNSDAHSLGKIAREYNRIEMMEPCFRELVQALLRQGGRRVAGNYGLRPKLGKYYRTFCAHCQKIADRDHDVAAPCAFCGSTKMVRGVSDRIMHIADREHPRFPEHRPPYHYQIPLEFIPGLGRKKLDLLLERFGTEMNILHFAPGDQLASCAGGEIADFILRAREGTLELQAGGGGQYGKIVRP